MPRGKRAAAADSTAKIPDVATDATDAADAAPSRGGKRVKTKAKVVKKQVKAAAESSSHEKPQLLVGTDGKTRCSWCGTRPEYTKYHDEEWGRPQKDDQLLFEMLSLGGAQAGLNWATILGKRDGYRSCFHAFNIRKCAEMKDSYLEELMQNTSIIRNRAKIQAVRVNAVAAQQIIREHGSLSEFLWGFAPKSAGKGRVGGTCRVTCTEGDAMSAALKQRGMKFVGPTIIYAFMQTVGMVNDHLIGCDFSNPDAQHP